MVKTNLTENRIREIAGPMEDNLVARVIATGADEPELLAAVEWLAEDDAMARALHGFSHGTVSELCDILSAGDPLPGDER